jgi:UV DNA damage endonuclease
MFQILKNDPIKLTGFMFTNMNPNRIRLGLCCINTELHKKGVFCSRKPILNTVAKKGVTVLIDSASANLDDLITMIEWNHEHGIEVFRMSSELLPHYNNDRLAPDVRAGYQLSLFHDQLKRAGALAKQYGQRLTFHPGQYNVLASPNETSYQRTLADLGMHAAILDYMEVNLDSVMVIHGGGIYGDREATKAKWIERYHSLPLPIKQRLVLENCERCFSIRDCLDISEATGVPVVLDNHHFDCYRIQHAKEKFEPIEYYIPLVLETWLRKGLRPKFHISEQAIGKRIGGHSDLISKLPNYYVEIPALYGVGIDIMIEAKLKEQALFPLMRLHGLE